MGCVSHKKLNSMSSTVESNPIITLKSRKIASKPTSRFSCPKKDIFTDTLSQLKSTLIVIHESHTEMEFSVSFNSEVDKAT